MTYKRVLLFHLYIRSLYAVFSSALFKRTNACSLGKNIFDVSSR